MVQGGANPSQLQATYELDNGQYIVHIVNKEGTELKTDQLNGGEIMGLVDSYQELISQAEARIDDLAYYLVKEVNILHKGDSTASNFNGGYDLYGAQGEAFFVENSIYGLTDANHIGASRKIAISNTILNDPRKIATALPLDGRDTIVSATNPVNYNNNENALAIAQLQHNKHELSSSPLELKDQTFNEFYSSSLFQIGQNIKNAQDKSQYYDTMYQQFYDKKQSITGVSLDEQFANLIQYQTTYNASAKMISVADEMLQTIVNLVN